MIIDEFVEVRINNSNKKHLEKEGYKNLIINEWVLILVCHLTKGSHARIWVECDECGNTKQLEYRDYLNNIKNHNFYTCSKKCAHDSGKNKKTNLERHGDENYNNHEKTKQTLLDNFGVENVFQLEEVKEKSKKTCLDKFGVEYSLQSLEVRKKGDETKEIKYGDPNYTNREQAKLTTKERHGNENYNNREQAKETCLERYGDENYTNIEKQKETVKNKSEEEKQERVFKMKQTKLERHGNESYVNSEKQIETLSNRTEEEQKEINDKRIKTCLKLYGVEYISQNSKILEKLKKNSYKLKEYILPSGKIVKVQGYEPWALDLLLKTYKECDLLIENKDIENKIGQIWYIGKDKKKHRYISDIYIISENKIVEVKSTWTFERYREKNLLKEQRCLDMGMKFEFMIFNGKKQLLNEEEVKELII